MLITYSNHKYKPQISLILSISSRLLDLDAKSKLNEIFHEIATLINDASMSSILSDLLAIYNVDAITRDEVHSIVYNNLHWLDTHTNNIRIFLNDFHNASTSLAFKAISYLIIIFGLALNWIMSLMFIYDRVGERGVLVK